MLKRILTAIVAICVFIPILIFSNTIVFPIAFALASFIGVYEVLKCIGVKSKTLYIISSLIALAAPFGARFAHNGQLFVLSYFGVFFCYLVVVLTIATFSHGKYDVSDAALSYVMTFYVITSFSSIIMLRDSRYGTMLYLLAFLGPWISDSAAYFCGRAFGRHKLIPDVSPKKTIEGAVGGVIFTGITFAAYGFVVLNRNAGLLQYVVLFAVGMIVSAVAQIGDLIASLVKRKYGVKDYGYLFPGHGGVMDRFDSVLITAPILLVIAEIASHYSIF